MTSQLNNSNDNQDQMLQETETLRPVFFDQSSNRGSVSVGPASESTTRARLGSSVISPDDHRSSEVPSQDESIVGPHESIPPSSTPLDMSHHHHHASLHHHRHIAFQHHILDGGGVDGVKPTIHKFDAAADSGSPMASLTSPSTSNFASTSKDSKSGHSSSFSRKVSATRSSHIAKKSVRVPTVASTVAASYSKSPKLFRRFRSRSLPIINYTSRGHFLQQQQQQNFASQSLKASGGTGSLMNRHVADGKSTEASTTQHSRPIHPSKNLSSLSASIPSLPPINLQSLKEIDLQEILKNPQLRHDILFDPQLQFRPNLDGDRGRRKKSVIERYWTEIEHECKQFFEASVSSGAQPAHIHRLPALFTTLRDILLSLLPVKDRAQVNEIMDMELVVQQFAHGSFDFVAMAHWLGEVFKSHCAPMRDQWVSDMITRFEEASSEISVVKLVQGLRSIFSILEAMKLDVANHQIRILRPVLIETAVDFERDYFNQLISHRKIDVSDSLNWFYKSYQRNPKASSGHSVDACKSALTTSIIDLLSCRNMASEFPSTLAFDHTRLVLLRADVRQLVCVQLCIVLFKQLISNYDLSAGYRAASLSVENVTRVQEEILAIVTDEHGNVKWTRNIRSIAIQLVKNVVTDPSSPVSQSTKLPQPLIDFSYNWLLKQIQPSSDVYGLMEGKIFKSLISEVSKKSSDSSSSQSNSDFKLGNNKLSFKNKKAESEMSGITNRISTLMKFHWNVFGDLYVDYIQSQKHF